jgi:uncharacterized protein (DUF433 family)
MTEHTGNSEVSARVVVEPGRRSGRAVIRGTRIAVSDILSMLAAGMTTDDVLADFPELDRADIAAALAHAAELEGRTIEAGHAA